MALDYTKEEKLIDMRFKEAKEFQKGFVESIDSAGQVLSKKIKKSLTDGSSQFKKDFNKSMSASLTELKQNSQEIQKAGAGDAGKAWAEAAEGAAQGLIGASELKSVGLALLEALGDEIPEKLKESIESAINNMELEEARKEFESSMEQGMNSMLSGLPSNAFTKAIGMDKGIEAGVKQFTEKFSAAGAKVGQFIADNWKLALGAALVMGILMALDDLTNEIGDSFGAIGVKNFKTDLIDAKSEFVQMGMSAEDLSATVQTLSGDFGLSTAEAIELSGSIADTSKALGLTAQEGSNLVGLLTTTAGLSAQQAQNFMKGAEMLAVANGVAPGIVMKDIAEASEDVALFTKRGGENIAAAAVQARKMGTNLSTVAKLSRGILNVQESLQAEMEASAMLGRRINLQRARELALSGDLAGVAKEIANQVGGQAAFENMNVLEREALANAVGLSSTELSKFISLQGKSNDELKKTTQYDVSEVVGKDAIGNIQAMKNDLEAAKLQMLSFISSIATLGGLLEGGPSWLVALNVGLIALGGYLLFTVGRTLIQALANRVLAKSIKKVTEAELERAAADMKASKGGGFFKSLGKGMTGLLKGAAALLIIAGAMFVFGAALQLFADVNWANVFIGIGALVLLGIVAAVLGYFAPITMIGAQVMLLLAASMLVLGIAAMAFAKATELLLPFLQFMMEAGAGLFLPLASLAAGLYVLLPALILLGITQLMWFPAMVLLSLGMAMLGVGLGVASVGMGLFNEQMQVMVDNTPAMAETTLAVTAFAGALFLLAAALAAVTFTGALALPILSGLAVFGGATLGLVMGGLGMASGGEGEETTRTDLYDQLVLMNERLAGLEERFEKDFVPDIVHSNVEGAERGAKASTRAAIGLGSD